MITAVDSSVLLAIMNQDGGWRAWERALEQAALQGQLVICEVAFAETSLPFPDVGSQLEAFRHLQLDYDPILPEAAHLAGRIFRAYRQAGGPRDHLLPDFLVAAHARVQADRMAAVDRGYLRRYFPDLVLLQSG